MSTQELEKQLAEETTKLKGALQLIKNFEIEDDDDAAFVTSEIKTVKSQWKAFEERRTSITKPMNEALRNVNALFKAPQNALKAMEREWKKKILEAAERKEAERQKLLAEAAGKASEEGAPEEVMIEARNVLIKAAEAKLETTGVSFRDNWTFEITDVDQIPREYLVPDTVAIGKVVKALKDKTKIPGVSVRNEKVVASR